MPFGDGGVFVFPVVQKCGHIFDPVVGGSRPLESGEKHFVFDAGVASEAVRKFIGPVLGGGEARSGWKRLSGFMEPIQILAEERVIVQELLDERHGVFIIPVRRFVNHFLGRVPFNANGTKPS